MSLIEQLGGYEKASRELGLKEKNSVLQCCIAVTAEMIREALLKHRREHNIFEVFLSCLSGSELGTTLNNTWLCCTNLSVKGFSAI